MVLQQKFALKNGSLISIDDVVKGLACGCTCPSCGSILVAKKGQIKIHHFAHHNVDDCVGALESSLHYLAKEILANDKHMVMPSLEHPNELTNLMKAKDVVFDEVYLEKSEGNFRPDVKCVVGDKSIFIEIAVTHFIDFEKLEKIEKRGIATIEIDLSWLDLNYTYEDVKQILLGDHWCKEWAYNPKIDYLAKRYDKVEEERRLRLVEEFTSHGHNAKINEY